MKFESVWIETGPDLPPLPRLEGSVKAEVAVVGGGIVGITTALLLAEAGVDVVLLEAGRIGRGVSGHTTAKVTSQHGLIYSQLRSKFGADGARTYAAANQAALAWIADRIERDGVACDFRRQPAYLYMEKKSGRAKLEREAEAAIEAGLPAALLESIPLPYPVAGAVRFGEQAEFHASRYLLALAERIEAVGGRMFEDSRAVAVSDGSPCTVTTAVGRVSAERVVVASHYPFLDRSLAFARLHPSRSYAIAGRIACKPPLGMYINGESPTRSLRAVPLEGHELLLVGGEAHRPGEGGDTEQRYRNLERFARAHWQLESVDYR